MATALGQFGLFTSTSLATALPAAVAIAVASVPPMTGDVTLSVSAERVGARERRP